MSEPQQQPGWTALMGAFHGRVCDDGDLWVIQTHEAPPTSGAFGAFVIPAGQWPSLARRISHLVRTHHLIRDGEEEPGLSVEVEPATDVYVSPSGCVNLSQLQDDADTVEQVHLCEWPAAAVKITQAFRDRLEKGQYPDLWAKRPEPSGDSLYPGAELDNMSIAGMIGADPDGFVWTGSFSGFEIEATGVDELCQIRHRCGWSEVLHPADHYLGNVMMTAMGHRAMGCNPR